MEVPYQNIDIEKEGLNRASLAQITGNYTVPQIPNLRRDPIPTQTQPHALQN